MMATLKITRITIAQKFTIVFRKFTSMGNTHWIF
jgi:hypothetical protein